MAKILYIYDPKLVAPTGSETVFLCYSLLEWEQGMTAIPHLPCNDETRVGLIWGDGLVEVKQKVIDNCIASFSGATSNDVIFLGGWN